MAEESDAPLDPRPVSPPGESAGGSTGSAGAPDALDGPGDHDLIRRAQGGEEAAFEALVRRHEDRAFRVAWNLIGNREDARDLAQEAFLRVFRSLERFDFRHEFSTWLYRIVTNLAIDALRKRRPAVSTAPGAGPGAADDEPGWDLPDPGDLPSDAIEREETAVRVREVVDRLAPHFRTVMVLRELEGLPCTEIAEIVGATHVTVRWRLHRGRKLFQEEWERMERQAGLPQRFRSRSVEAPEGDGPPPGRPGGE